MNSMDFGRLPLLYYPIALFTIFSVFLLSKHIELWKKENLIKKTLIFFGDNSLLIFVFQSLYLRLYLFVFNKFQGLDMELYMDNPFYHQLGSFVLITFILSPLTIKTILFLRNKGLNII
jgi:hypothetical protein